MKELAEKNINNLEADFIHNGIPCKIQAEKYASCFTITLNPTETDNSLEVTFLWNSQTKTIEAIDYIFYSDIEVDCEELDRFNR